MRVLLVSGSFPPMRCGVGDYTALLAEGLAEHAGADVAVITDERAASPREAPYTVFPVAKGWRAGDVPAILRAAATWKPDIVHVQYPTQGYGARLMPWLIPTLFAAAGYPVVQTWHECHSSLRNSKRNWPNLFLAGGLVVVRPQFMQTVSPLQRRILERKHVRVIPNASSLPIARLTESRRSEIRQQYTTGGRRLVVYFGFVSPLKGVELLFDIADPERDSIVLCCDIDPSDSYHDLLLTRSAEDRWKAHTTVTGFLPSPELAEVLAAADAVVLPFRDGGGIWNTSIHGAAAQGTFVLTTAATGGGYDAGENIYWALPGDKEAMREALTVYGGVRQEELAMTRRTSWDEISRMHLELYNTLTFAAGPPAI